LRAPTIPVFGRLITRIRLSLAAKRCRIGSVPSVDPSSTIKNSKSVKVWARILSMASAT